MPRLPARAIALALLPIAAAIAPDFARNPVARNPITRPAIARAQTTRAQTTRAQTTYSGVDSDGNLLTAVRSGDRLILRLPSGEALSATADGRGQFRFLGQRFDYLATPIGRNQYRLEQLSRNGNPTHWIALLSPTTGDSGDRRPRWSHVYQCGDYRVTLRELRPAGFGYEIADDANRLQLQGGRRQNTGNSWVYRFADGNREHQLEDAWARAPGDRGWAELRIYDGGALALRRACDK